MSGHHEIERAYDVGVDDALPDLTRLAGVAAVTEAVVTRLTATYHDTDDLALVRGGVTLRRRVGGDDEGWHLKVPVGDGRDEIHRPLGGPRVPAVLARLATAWSRGRVLGPVCEIETVRSARLLLDASGEVVAEVADDSAVGRPVDGAPAVVWREVEVELGPAAPGAGWLDEVDAVLAEAGIHPRGEQRKVSTVLAHRLADVAPPGVPSRERPASLVLHARLAEQVDALRRHDCDVRRRGPDGVHQLRVACRRLRGALATFRPLVDRSVTDPLRDELRWLARTLGEARDAEVSLRRLRGLVDREPSTLVVGPVRRRLRSHYAGRRRVATGRVDGVLASERYLRLLAGLDALVASPPFTEVADRPAAEVLVKRVRKDVRRLDERVSRARSAEGVDREAAWHDVRKAAKRLRYGCETLEPWWGSDVKRLRKAAQAITRVLGDRNDVAVARADLLRIAAEASAAGESAFTYGRLHAAEEACEARTAEDFHEGWERLQRPKAVRWLR